MFDNDVMTMIRDSVQCSLITYSLSGAIESRETSREFDVLSLTLG